MMKNPNCACFNNELQRETSEQTVFQVAAAQSLSLRVATISSGLCESALYNVVVYAMAIAVHSIAADDVNSLDPSMINVRVEEILAALPADLKLCSDHIKQVMLESCGHTNYNKGGTLQ